MNTLETSIHRLVFLLVLLVDFRTVGKNQGANPIEGIKISNRFITMSGI